MKPRWLAFTPSYTAPRGIHTRPVGAHAFRDDAPRSLCGFVKRERAGDAADAAARRCTWCIRVVDEVSADYSGGEVRGVAEGQG